MLVRLLGIIRDSDDDSSNEDNRIDYKEEFSKVTIKLNELKEHYATQEQQLAKCVQDLEISSANYLDLKLSYEKIDKEMNEATKMLYISEKESNKVTLELNELKENYSTQEQQLMKCINDLEISRANNSDSKLANEKLEKRLNDTTSRLMQMIDLCDERQSSLESTENNLETLKSKYDHNQRTCAILQQQINELTDLNTKLQQSQTDELEDTWTLLIKTKEALQQRVPKEHLEECEDRVRGLEEKLVEQKKDLQRKSKDNNKLTHQLAELQQLYSQAVNEYELLQVTEEKTGQANLRLQQENSRLQKEVEKYSNRNDGLMSEIIALKDAQNKAHVEAMWVQDALTASQNELISVRGELSLRIQEKSALSLQLFSCRSDFEKVSQEYNYYKSTRDSQAHHTNHLKTKYESLQREYSLLNQQLLEKTEVLLQSLKSAELQQQQWMGEREGLETEVRSHKEVIRRLTEQLGEFLSEDADRREEAELEADKSNVRNVHSLMETALELQASQRQRRMSVSHGHSDGATQTERAEVGEGASVLDGLANEIAYLTSLLEPDNLTGADPAVSLPVPTAARLVKGGASSGPAYLANGDSHKQHQNGDVEVDVEGVYPYSYGQARVTTLETDVQRLRQLVNTVTLETQRELERAEESASASRREAADARERLREAYDTIARMVAEGEALREELAATKEELRGLQRERAMTYELRCGELERQLANSKEAHMEAIAEIHQLRLQLAALATPPQPQLQIDSSPASVADLDKQLQLQLEDREREIEQLKVEIEGLTAKLHHSVTQLEAHNQGPSPEPSLLETSPLSFPPPTPPPQKPPIAKEGDTGVAAGQGVPGEGGGEQGGICDGHSEEESVLRVYRERVVSLEGRNRDLEGRNRDLQRRLTDSMVLQQEHDTEISDCRRRLSDETVRCSALEQQVKDLKDQRTTLTQVQAVSYTGSQKELFEWRSKCEDLDFQVVTLTQTVTDLTATSNELKLKNEKLVEEVSILRDRLSEAQKRLRTAEELNITLQLTIPENRSNGQVEGVQARDKGGSGSSREAEGAEAGNMEGEVKRLAKENEALRVELGESRARWVEDTKRARKDLHNQMTALEGRLAETERRLGKAVKEGVEAVAALSAATDKIGSLEGELQQARHELALTSKERERVLRKRLSDMNTAHSRMVSQVSMLEEVTKDAQQGKGELETKCLQLEGELVRLRKSKGGLDTEDNGVGCAVTTPKGPSSVLEGSMSGKESTASPGVPKEVLSATVGCARCAPVIQGILEEHEQRLAERDNQSASRLATLKSQQRSQISAYVEQIATLERKLLDAGEGDRRDVEVEALRERLTQISRELEQSRTALDVAQKKEDPFVRGGRSEVGQRVDLHTLDA